MEAIKSCVVLLVVISSSYLTGMKELDSYISDLPIAFDREAEEDPSSDESSELYRKNGKRKTSTLTYPDTDIKPPSQSSVRKTPFFLNRKGKNMISQEKYKKFKDKIDGAPSEYKNLLVTAYEKHEKTAASCDKLPHPFSCLILNLTYKNKSCPYVPQKSSSKNPWGAPLNHLKEYHPDFYAKNIGHTTRSKRVTVGELKQHIKKQETEIINLKNRLRILEGGDRKV